MDFLVSGDHCHHLATHAVEQYALGDPFGGHPCRACGFDAGLSVWMRHDLKRNHVLVEKALHAMQCVHDRLLGKYS
jgi:hypothetical protein